MKTKIIIVVICSLFTSCEWFNNKRGVQLEIRNESNQNITNISFYTIGSERFNFELIEQGKEVKSFFDMSNTPKSDGGYTISFARNEGKQEYHGGGYFTNGTPSNRKVICIIQNDTVIMKFK